jgi:hypothetical protein
MSRLSQKTVEIFSGLWSSRWITADERPMSVAWSRTGKKAAARLAMPYSSGVMKRWRRMTVAPKSSMPTSVLASPIQARPRLMWAFV